MSDTVIQVENLSKKYILDHQQEGQQYKALRDVIANGAKSMAKRLRYAKSVAPNPSREEFWALKDVNFEIKQGDRVGIIGRNGAGKSTLLKILSRIVEPTRGRIGIRGRVASLLEVGTGFHPELTGRENIFLNGAILGMSKAEIQRKFDEIVAFAEVEKFLDTPVKRYSSGMYVRLAFAVAAHLEPEILIVDEVLAVGDAQFQKKCLGKMEDVGKEGRTVLFVSHNMATIRHLCNKGILLKAGQIASHGRIEQVLKDYESQVLNSQDSLGLGVIYANCVQKQDKDFIITKIEVLDELDRCKASVKTWDYVKFRVHYHAKRFVNHGSGVVRMTTLDNIPIMLCATMPDLGIPMEIEVGSSYFDCIFDAFPLASGDYLLEAMLAIPMKEWLCGIKEPALLHVDGNDVFNSGFPPINSRALIVAPYTIQLPEKYSLNISISKANS